MTPRPDNAWPDMWNRKSDASKRKEKQKVGYRETKARKYQKIAWYFIDPDDEEFKDVMKKCA